VAICLFDAIVALNVSKIKKKRIFLYFFKFTDILPMFMKRCFLDLDDFFTETIFVTLVANSIGAFRRVVF
jgi:hypothetical protein